MKALISAVAMGCLIAGMAVVPTGSAVAAKPYRDCIYHLRGNTSLGTCSKQSSGTFFTLTIRCVSSTGRVEVRRSPYTVQGQWVTMQCKGGTTSSHYFTVYQV